MKQHSSKAHVPPVSIVVPVERFKNAVFHGIRQPPILLLPACGPCGQEREGARSLRAILGRFETLGGIAVTRAVSAHQLQTSVEKNASFFRENHAAYIRNVREIDTYGIIRCQVNEALRGIHRLLDIGSGGVFDYDTRAVSSIVALDLFFDGLPASIHIPENITRKQGDALEIPEPDSSFDGVLMVMMLHHLVGKSVQQSLSNARRAVDEAFRVLKPSGRLIVVESCVPSWFYAFERAVFPLASAAIHLLLRHPATLQYPPCLIAALVAERAALVESGRIPKGRWILQYGIKFPAALTPASPYRFVAQKGP
jgi:SAM-dependent methyltransferase